MNPFFGNPCKVLFTVDRGNGKITTIRQPIKMEFKELLTVLRNHCGQKRATLMYQAYMINPRDTPASIGLDTAPASQRVLTLLESLHALNKYIFYICLYVMENGPPYKYI